MVWFIVIEMFFAQEPTVFRGDHGFFTLRACNEQVVKLAQSMIHVPVVWVMRCEGTAVEREARGG